MLTRESSNAGAYLGVKYQHSPSDSSFYAEMLFRQVDTNHGGQIEFWTDNSSGTAAQRMTINKSGNVGIGTASPSAEVPLTVVYSTTSQFHIGGAQAGISNNVYYNGSAYTNRNTNAGGSLLQLSTDGSFAFRRATSGSSPTLTYSMYIDTSGNVGINDNNPDRKVSIIGDSTSSGQYPLSLDATNTDYTLEFRRNGNSEWWIKQAGGSFNIHENGGADRFRILAGGNIGIGTTSPAQLLEVSGNAKKSRFTRSGSAGTTMEFFAGAAQAGGIQVQNTGLGIGGGTRENELFLTTDGKVGIGTVSPYTDLDVAGQIAMSIGNAHAVFSTDTSGKIYIKANENKVNATTAIHMQMPIVSGSGTLEDKLVINHSDITAYKHFLPAVNGTQNLGSSSLRWANVYTGDLHLSNEEKGGNDVDGTTGNWTVQEGEENLYLINNKTGKKYKFALEEIE
jgi:hypothetical protein